MDVNIFKRGYIHLIRSIMPSTIEQISGGVNGTVNTMKQGNSLSFYRLSFSLYNWIVSYESWLIWFYFVVTWILLDYVQSKHYILFSFKSKWSKGKFLIFLDRNNLSLIDFMVQDATVVQRIIMYQSSDDRCW